MDRITLHRDERRHEYWADAAPPIFFAEEIDSWLCMDPKEIDALMRVRSTRAGTADVLLAYEQLAFRHGRSFPNLLFACRYIPLCFEGDEHRRVRRRLAGFLASSRSAATARLDGIVEDSLAGLRADGEIDVMADVVDPMVSRFMAGLTGVDLPDPTSAFGLLATFDRMIGLRRRQELEERISRIRQAIRAAIGPEANEEEEGLRLAGFVLGQDTLRGTLGESLYQLLRSFSGRRFAEIDYPSLPNETGVPLVERIVTEPFEFGGHHFASGERIRVAMQGLVYSRMEEDRDRMFGIGSHSCLGRQLSLDLWSRLTATLRRLPTKPEILRYEVRTDDYTFLVPSLLMIRVRL